MSLDAPEVFVYFLLHRRLILPTHERTPADPALPRNLGVRQFVLGCENGRAGLEFLAIRNLLMHDLSALVSRTLLLRPGRQWNPAHSDDVNRPFRRDVNNFGA